MKILIEQSVYSREYNNVLAVARGVIWYGGEVVVWNPIEKSLIDVVSEIKPDVLIHSSEIKKNAKFVIDSFGIRTDNISQFTKLLCDPIVYKKQSPSSYFECDNIGMIQYPGLESVDCMQKYIHPNFNQTFRLFSPVHQPSAKYCGWIPDTMFSLVLSSCKNVITASEYTAVNAILCNDNVFIGNEKYSTDIKDMICDRSSVAEALHMYMSSNENLAKFEEFINAY